MSGSKTIPKIFFISLVAILTLRQAGIVFAGDNIWTSNGPEGGDDRPPAVKTSLSVDKTTKIIAGTGINPTGNYFHESLSIANPQWKILVLIYANTDFTFTDGSGEHRVIAAMNSSETDRARDAATRFVETDIPALTSGYMIPILTIRYPNRALTSLDSYCGYWPSRGNTAPELDPQFDSVIVIWDDTGTDVNTGQSADLNTCGGLTVSNGTGQTYATFPVDSVSQNQRNVFKHEWGHSILFYYDAAGTAPQPAVDNHINDTDKQYVHCPTGAAYILQDETDDNPIVNSIYNNDVGFTHDYYSGTTAKPGQPGACLGITAQAWASGGPVSKPVNLSASPPSVYVGRNIQVSWNGLDPSGNDWISMHPGGAPDSDYLTWQSIHGTSGSITFQAPSASGEIDFRLFRNGTKVAISNLVNTKGSSFADVPVDNALWPYIEALYNSGVTTGCGVSPLIYCPDSAVTRAAMAVFLLRAKYGSSYTPPAATHTFADLPVAGKEWQEAWVDQFYLEGITAGCGTGPLIYCPETAVTRAAMAVFILRAKYGSSYTPPAASHYFADLPVAGKEWMEPWADELYREGITTGCGTGPLIYCPETAVKRQAMAAFIVRAFNLPMP